MSETVIETRIVTELVREDGAPETVVEREIRTELVVENIGPRGPQGERGPSGSSTWITKEW